MDHSWIRASKLLVEVARHGETTGYEVPCVIVAAKDDLESSTTSIQDSTRVYNYTSLLVINMNN